MLHTIALTLTPRVGSRTLGLLIDTFGSARAVFEMGREQLIEAGVAPSLAEHIASGRAMERAAGIVEHCTRSGIRILVKGTPEYPALLSECDDAPGVLYVRGDLDLSRGRYVSVVGTRKATQHGLYDTEKLIAELGAAYDDLVVVSGLAFGIDKAAHVAALNHSVATVAVMPGWVDDISPMSHFYVARRILQSHGAVISDMPPGTVISKGSFLSRNRIIAGLSEATFVVESAAKGGSLITADLALGYNREVFAMPGRAEDPNAGGTNALIKTSRAMLYQDVSDVAQTLGWPRAAAQQRQEELPINLPERLLRIFSAMPDTAPVMLDEIVQHLGITVAEASSGLSMLEVKGLIKSLPGRLYQKTKF